MLLIIIYCYELKKKKKKSLTFKRAVLQNVFHMIYGYVFSVLLNVFNYSHFRLLLIQIQIPDSPSIRRRSLALRPLGCNGDGEQCSLPNYPNKNTYSGKIYIVRFQKELQPINGSLIKPIRFGPQDPIRSLQQVTGCRRSLWRETAHSRDCRPRWPV